MEWVSISFPRGASQPRDEPRSPTLQADSLLSEPPGKPHNLPTGKRRKKKNTIFIVFLSARKTKPLPGLFCLFHRLSNEHTSLCPQGVVERRGDDLSQGHLSVCPQSHPTQHIPEILMSSVFSAKKEGLRHTLQL